MFHDAVQEQYTYPSRIKPGSPPAFQVVDRSEGWAERRANWIRTDIEGMLKAEAEGDTRLMLALADQAVGWIMQARESMEKRGGQ